MNQPPILTNHKNLFCALALLVFNLPILGQTSDLEARQKAIDGSTDEARVPAVPSLLGASSVEMTEEGQRGTVPTVFQRIYRYVFEQLGDSIEQIEAQILEALPFEEGVVPLDDRDAAAALGNRDWIYSKDVLMPIPSPTEVTTFSPAFDTVAQAFWQNNRSAVESEGTTSVVAGFSYSEDGTQAGTMKVRLIAFDQDATQLFHATVDDNLLTFPGDPLFSRTGLAVGDQGRSTVAYTDVVPVPGGSVPQILARRVDIAGTILDATPIVINPAAIDPSAALLDPAGDRVVVVSTDFANIKGNVLDTSGATPTVGAQFQISTTPGQFLFLPSVASNPMTGDFLVVWEHLTGVAGNPQNIRARRFDASGNPVAPDFQVNTFDTNAQGQPAVAFGPGGESVVVWAGDAVNPGVDFLDVFFQAYDANGDPIGGEQRANSFTADFQDRPEVKFLPGLNAQGNPQFAIYWRDVENADGSGPRGTGTSYALFTIAGPVDPDIFADGFESGDTSAWSVTSP